MKYIGPLYISHQADCNSYVLSTIDGYKLPKYFHVNRLKKCCIKESMELFLIILRKFELRLK